MQLKRIDPKQVIYHYFEMSVSKFALYDDEFDMPVAYGSRNLVDSTIRHLNKKVTILYYKRDVNDKISYKMKIKYDGNKETSKGGTPPTIPGTNT